MIASALSLLSCALLAAAPQDPALYPRPGEFTMSWWAHGSPQSGATRRGNIRDSANAEQIFCFQTGEFAAALDVKKVALLHLGKLKPMDRKQALEFSWSDLQKLPAAALNLSVNVGGTGFRCTRGAVLHTNPVENLPVRVIDNGQVVQRIDIQNLAFESDSGARLAANARLEIIAWADRISFLLDLEPLEDWNRATATVSVAAAGWPALQQPMESAPWKKGEHKTAAATLLLSSGEALDSPLEIRASDPESGGRALETAFHPNEGWTQIHLPARNWQDGSGTYYPSTLLDRLNRVRFSIRNPTAKEQTARLLFLDDSHFPITGLTPMIRDLNGEPTGIPVQLSKNWHRLQQPRILYEGPWLHAFSQIHVPPRQTIELELALCYGRWGGVPAASHSQLSVISYSHNQLWEQIAIGSWGESICYEPDGVMAGCMMADIRPLFVYSKPQRGPSPPSPPPKYTWTGNVGGGDFLMFIDDKRRYQFFREMRALHESVGPNLTRAAYSGTTADDSIHATISVSTPRADDYLRCFHHFRYDVRKAAPFSRLAWYQVGADYYNSSDFSKIASGNLSGLVREWKVTPGGKKYDVSATPLKGPVPWISLHGTRVEKPDDTPATRGLVIRSWKARLGGRDSPIPYLAVYGTDWGSPHSVVELAPPPGLRQLEPGDFVEADVELVVLPMRADDYYGPDTTLARELASHENSWELVARETRANHLSSKMSAGRLLGSYPIEISARKGGAEFQFSGGAGYIPITFDHLPSHSGFELVEKSSSGATVVDQSVNGNDFWQAAYDPATRTWSRTYNLPSSRDPSVIRRFELRKKSR